MYFWGSITGFLMALLPCILLQFLFGNTKIRGRGRPIIMGAIFGLFVWLISGSVIYADLHYDIIGFMKKETGPTLMKLYRHTHYGFLTCGIVVGYFGKMLNTGKEREGGSQAS
jgi:hypothetical protein